ncbi:MAG: hypothetical protein ACOCWI_00335 [Bacillota bacterium]
MIYLFLSYLTLVFLFVFPFDFKAGSYFLLTDKKGGGYLELGIYRINFSIKASKDGFELNGLKKIKNRYKFVEDEIVKVKDDKKVIPISKKLIKQIYVDKFNVVMRYGNKDNAYNTAMVLSSVNMVSQSIVNLFYDKIKDCKKILIPEFNKDVLYLDVKISLKVNLLLIFSILFKIITNSITNSIREILYERN